MHISYEADEQEAVPVNGDAELAGSAKEVNSAATIALDAKEEVDQLLTAISSLIDDNDDDDIENSEAQSPKLSEEAVFADVSGEHTTSEQLEPYSIPGIPDAVPAEPEEEPFLEPSLVIPERRVRQSAEAVSEADDSDGPEDDMPSTAMQSPAPDESLPVDAERDENDDAPSRLEPVYSEEPPAEFSDVPIRDRLTGDEFSDSEWSEGYENGWENGYDTGWERGYAAAQSAMSNAAVPVSAPDVSDEGQTMLQDPIFADGEIEDGFQNEDVPEPIPSDWDFADEDADSDDTLLTVEQIEEFIDDDGYSDEDAEFTITNDDEFAFALEDIDDEVNAEELADDEGADNLSGDVSFLESNEEWQEQEPTEEPTSQDEAEQTPDIEEEPRPRSVARWHTMPAKQKKIEQPSSEFSTPEEREEARQLAAEALYGSEEPVQTYQLPKVVPAASSPASTAKWDVPMSSQTTGEAPFTSASLYRETGEEQKKESKSWLVSAIVSVVVILALLGVGVYLALTYLSPQIDSLLGRDSQPQMTEIVEDDDNASEPEGGEAEPAGLADVAGSHGLSQWQLSATLASAKFEGDGTLSVTGTLSNESADEWHGILQLVVLEPDGGVAVGIAPAEVEATCAPGGNQEIAFAHVAHVDEVADGSSLRLVAWENGPSILEGNTKPMLQKAKDDFLNS